MNTAQNLKFPKEVLERISGTLTLSCFQYALLKGVVGHTALMMFHSSLVVQCTLLLSLVPSAVHFHRSPYRQMSWK